MFSHFYLLTWALALNYYSFIRPPSPFINLATNSYRTQNTSTQIEGALVHTTTAHLFSQSGALYRGTSTVPLQNRYREASTIPLQNWYRVASNSPFPQKFRGKISPPLTGDTSTVPLQNRYRDASTIPLLNWYREVSAGPFPQQRYEKNESPPKKTRFFAQSDLFGHEKYIKGKVDVLGSPLKPVATRKNILIMQNIKKRVSRTLVFRAFYD